jgi:hypothetical protein
MKNNRLILFANLCLFVLLIACNPDLPKNAIVSDTAITIFPDYTDLVIPPNIAPLNFKTEGTDKICVRYYSDVSDWTVYGKDKINLPDRKWKKLLSDNSGKKITVEIYTKKGTQWIKHKPFFYEVAADSIDKYLAYRLIAPGFAKWDFMGLYQRNLESFKEETILNNDYTKKSCMNCHTFRTNNPDEMVFHIRQYYGATYLLQNEKYSKLNTKTDYTLSNCVYPYWHPSGKYIAFSTNKTSQMLHALPNLGVEVYDDESDIVVSDIQKNELFSDTAIHKNNILDTYPAFSPDGKTLYFCRYEKQDSLLIYNRIKYSLCAIGFDEQTATFGNKIDTLISSTAINKSVTFAHPSLDGKYIILALSDYGCFPSWNKESDLYLFDLNTMELKRPETINSEFSEGFTTWSSNSKWLVFSSRRGEQLYNRPYFSHIDDNGKFSKPFVLPQEDPDFYTFSLYAYNKPELVKNKIKANPKTLLEVAKQNPIQVNFRDKDFKKETHSGDLGSEVN